MFWLNGRASHGCRQSRRNPSGQGNGKEVSIEIRYALPYKGRFFRRSWPVPALPGWIPAFHRHCMFRYVEKLFKPSRSHGWIPFQHTFIKFLQIRKLSPVLQIQFIFHQKLRNFLPYVILTVCLAVDFTLSFRAAIDLSPVYPAPVF